jgi:hypothetical protein
MAIYGVRAAVDSVAPTGIDAGWLFEKTVLKGKKTVGEILNELAAAVGSTNQFLADEYSNMVTIKESMYSYYRNATGESRYMTELDTEYKRPDPRRGATIAHMLPLKHFSDALGWTQAYLKNAHQEQITADINEITDAWANRVDYDIWTRALTNTENVIGNAGTGYDVGWAIGTGTNVNYIPPQTRYGAVFTSSHSHYNFLDDDTNDWGDLLEDNVEDLREHLITGPLVCITSKADRSEYTALTNFVQNVPERIDVNLGSASTPLYTTSGTYEGIPGTVYGYYVTDLGDLVSLVYHDRVPANYNFTFAVENVKPLALRLDDDEPFGLKLDVEVTSTLNPKIQQISMEGSHGVGVNDRLAGVAGYLASGAASYVNPTIS